MLFFPESNPNSFRYLSLQQFIHAEEIDLETSLDLIRAKIAPLNQDLFKISHEKENYAKLLEDSLYQIGNI